jgi:hypothetical protein
MARFRRVSRRSVILQISALTAVLAGLIVTATAQSGGKRLASLANPVVNAPDTTEHDTQSTVAMVKVQGTSIWVAAFNNSALYTGSNNHIVGWSRTTNDGATWTDGGTLPNSADGDGGEPVLARDNTSGTIYLTTQNFSGSGVQLFRSTDNGASWLAPVDAFSNFTGGDTLESPWVVVDQGAGTGQGYVYVTAKNVAGGGAGSQAAGTYVRRSTDGGATFGSQNLMSNIWQGGTLAVQGHAVYAAGWASLSPRAIRVKKSTDFGVTFGAFVTAATLTGASADGDLGLGGGFKTNSNPRFVTGGGELFIFYNDKNGTDKSDIFVVGSTDGGATWDSPFRINNDTTDRDQFMPSAAWTTTNSHILVTWYDRRSDPANSLIERWGVLGTRAQGECCTLSPNFRLSTGSWPVVIGQDSYAPPTYMGNYEQTASGSNSFIIGWGDNRLPNPANSPLPHANQPDVRAALIRISGPPRGDLDRDLQTDRTIFRPSSGFWYTALSSGGATSTGWGVSTDIDVLGDYDGDEKSDVAVFRPSSGQWYIVNSSDGAVRVVTWGVSGDMPLAGDVDGDGADDLVIYRPSAGAWFINFSSGGSDGFAWGTAGDLPLLGDYVDGNGADDLTIFRPSTGTWYSFSPWTGTFIAANWGVSTDIPVAGDYDKDGLADPTIFRPGTGQWYVKKSTGGTLAVTWGVSGDIPVSGDWDGDGASDFTIFRDSAGAWYTQFAAGGTAAVAWGVSGDKPSGRRPGS